MGSVSLTDFTRTWVTEEKGYVDGEGERERGIERLQRDYILNERFFGWASGEWHSLNGDGTDGLPKGKPETQPRS